MCCQTIEKASSISIARKALWKNTGFRTSEAIHPTSEDEEKAEERNVSVFLISMTELGLPVLQAGGSLLGLSATLYSWSPKL